LETKKADLQSKYNDLINAKDEKWEEMKNAFSSAADSFKEGFSKISSLF
jgi:chromosome segregation ATPase